RAEIDWCLRAAEPLPAVRQSGDTVSAGTLSPTGAFTLRAAAVGTDTLLARIIRLVEDALDTEAPIQRLADRVSGWFVPAVLAVAAVTWIAWWRLAPRSEEHTSELQSRENLVCRLLL